MKINVLVLLAFATVISSCGGGSDTAKKDSEQKTTVDRTQNPDYQKGLQIVANSDCLTCHRVDERLQGPTYREIANKYANYPDTIVTHLAKKIIDGGTGVWGEIAMTPHPQLTPEEAESCVKYILLLKDEK